MTKTAVQLILDQCPGGKIEGYVQRGSWEKHPDLLLPSMIFLKGNKLDEKWRLRAIAFTRNTHNPATVKANAEQNGNDVE